MLEGIPSRTHEYEHDPVLQGAYERAHLIGCYVGSLIMHSEAGRAMAIEHHERTLSHYQATHDPLTGLSNRAGLEEILAELGPNMEGVIVLFIDLTNLKAINDKLGHARGDQMILEFAGLLRSDDYAARLDGDEFIVLNMANRHVGKHDRRRDDLQQDDRTEAIRTRFERDMLELLQEHPDAAGWGFQAALGITTGTTGDTIEQLKAKAEQNMYENKDEQHKQLGQYRPPTVPRQRGAMDGTSSYENIEVSDTGDGGAAPLENTVSPPAT